MRELSPEQLVRLWEEGVDQHPTDRALAILRAADPHPDAPDTPLGALPLGERDRRLLDVRQRTFGRRMDAVVSCPHCGSIVELRCSTHDFILQPDDRQADHAFVEICGRHRRIRPLTSRDLAAAARCATPGSARRVLAACCVEPMAADAVAGADDFSDADLDIIAGALERIDPGAVRTLNIACPDCGAPREYELDVAQFLWTEIEAAAIRLLRDVHAIARAYGWSERDILAMTPIRRRTYLELVQ
jgi:hypothetical protein